MPRKNEDFALIWWKSGSTDIVSCNKIKLKDRIEGKEIKLMWSDITGMKKLHDATIIKIGEYY